MYKTKLAITVGRVWTARQMDGVDEGVIELRIKGISPTVKRISRNKFVMRINGVGTSGAPDRGGDTRGAGGSSVGIGETTLARRTRTEGGRERGTDSRRVLPPGGGRA